MVQPTDRPTRPAARTRPPDFGAAATAALRHVKAGWESYDRARCLPRLIAMTPWELAACGPDVARAVVARLTRALRAERRRGRAGHWSYDLNRHIALAQALAAEQATGGCGR